MEALCFELGKTFDETAPCATACVSIDSLWRHGAPMRSVVSKTAEGRAMQALLMWMGPAVIVLLALKKGNL